MPATDRVNPNTTGDRQIPAERDQEKDALALATLSPPPSRPLTGIDTPSFDGDFRVICRGDEYGSYTRVAFRQITESNAVHERFCGVAVELESIFDFSEKRAAISRLMSDLRIPQVDICETVPPFVAVPRPEMTVLFLLPSGPADTPRKIAKAVQQHLSKLNTRTEIHSTLNAGNAAEPKQCVNLSNIVSEAEKMRQQLRASSTFPKWRLTHWSALEIAAVQALRPMINGATAGECASMFPERCKELGIPQMTASQRALVTAEFLSTANTLAERPAEAVSV